MILADKIIDERKKNGWSQEELADKLGVSRQSVSKWEGAQSTPDLQRILEMSKLFGVSTDYLLKDDETRPVTAETAEDDIESLRRVSMEEANEFLGFNKKFAGKISLGVLICTLCPVPLLAVMALQSSGALALSEDRAGSLGMVLLLAFVAVSLIFFIPAGISSSKWEWLEKEIFDTEYGVDGMVKERSEKHHAKFVRAITMGTVIILCGVITLIAGNVIDGDNDPLIMALASVMMACIAFGAFMITNAGIIKDGFSKLLQEGDYSKEEKSNKLLKTVTPVYWILVTAIYLAWTLPTNNWGFTWIVWPVAGVVFAGLSIVLKAAKPS